MNNASSSTCMSTFQIHMEDENNFLIKGKHYKLKPKMTSSDEILVKNLNKTECDEHLLPSDNIQPFQRPFRLIWKNVSYEIDNKTTICSFWKKPSYNGDQLSNHNHNSNGRLLLLNNLNGQIQSGQMTALIGPSGSGKTTLLECLAARRTISSGKISVEYSLVTSSANSLIRHNLAFMSHDDTMMMNLTVWETLNFATKLCSKNKSSIKKSQSQTKVLIEKLGLKQCSSVRVCQCSNGQQKRLSIALQLINEPNILLLDEPTNGLDSVSCLQCIHLLSSLTTEPRTLPLTILISIHQPTAFLLKHFHQIYVLALGGKCIYRGSPDNLVNHLYTIANLQCPNYHNPADFIVEVGFSQLETDGRAALEKLVQAASQLDKESHDSTMITVSIHKIAQQTRNDGIRACSYRHFGLIWSRCLLLQYRDPSEVILRILGTVSVILLIWLIYYGSSLGSSKGCFPRTELTNNIMDIFINRTLTEHDIREFMDYDRDSSTIRSHLWNKHQQQIEENLFNYGFLFFIQMFVTFISTMPVILSFPSEIQVIRRELSHGWYSLWIYFMAKNVANLILAIVLPMAFGWTAFLITEQPLQDGWRMKYFLLSLTLIALVGDGCGQWIGAMFVNNINQATIFASITQLVLVLFSGLFVSTRSLPYVIDKMTYISHYRLCFESLIIILYGYGRCSFEPVRSLDRQQILFNMKTLRKYFQNDTEEFIECLQNQSDTFNEQSMNLFIKLEQFLNRHNQENIENTSIAMQSFNLKDDDLYFNLILLSLYIILYRIMAFFVLINQIR